MKVGFLSLGCAKNLVDSEVMIGLLQRQGYELTTDPTQAEVLVVNTCGFIESAKKESVDAILEMAQHRREGACGRLVVTGCLAERYREELLREIPEIDAILGTDEVPQITRAADGPPPAPSSQPAALFTRETAVVQPAPPEPPPVASVPTYIYDAKTPRTLTTPAHMAYVKVAEGCDYSCAFCIIPTLRGAYRSRSISSVVEEARRLSRAGVRELILVSQDTTYYGVDRGDRDALARLLRELNSVPDLRWIRLLYLYPTTLTTATLDAMAECDKVCRYVDLPLQHASDAVLRRMRRPGTRRHYERLLQNVRERVPGVALRTTFIVGFPGETADDFEGLCAFAKEVVFDHLGVFTYSHEEGTPAHDLEDTVPVRVKQQRQRHLLALQRRLVARSQREQVGRVASVLVDGPSPEHDLVLLGRLEGQAPEIDSVVYLTDCDATQHRPGDLVRARVVGARGYDLLAAPLP